ncbi:uncharacterized protein [Choristoneura fumiferana]|uniref:uncharacterized protein n=1 Tax=Choristoneura fumiferana TaxID=7141 RepID=UPI003D155926
MAIAFNLPSEREPSEEHFSRLNRLLAELYEVLCHILVSRQPGQETLTQDSRRDAIRPYHSESDLNPPQIEPQCRLSASSPPLSLTFDELDDDVFVSPRDNANDLFSTRNVDIFGYRSPRTPAGVLLSPRRDRTFTFPETSEKHWRDKGGTDMADGIADADVTDAATPEVSTEDNSSESSLLSSIIPDKLSAGSICTAVLLMLGWKFLSKR